MTRTGKFIVFDGVDGAGKSTALEACAQALRQRGHRVLTTREPGGGAAAEAVRELLLRGWEPALSAECELLLVFAARVEHLKTRIGPALQRGEIVLCDRFVDSSYVYQGQLGGLPEAAIDELCARYLTIAPDRSLIFDLPPEISLQRQQQRGRGNRFDSPDQQRLQAIREGFLARIAACPSTHRRIAAERSPAEVLVQILGEVDACL